MIKKIIMDVDGVLADFTTAALSRFGKGHEVQIPGEYSIPKCLGITDEEFWARLDNYEFWSSVDLYVGAVDFVRNMAQLAPVVIATIPSNSSGSVRAKSDWLKKFFPDYDHLIGKKMHLAQPGYLLIDDFDKNVDEWRKAGGEAILFPRPWNSRHKDAEGRSNIGLQRIAQSEVETLLLRDRLSNAQEPHDIIADVRDNSVLPPYAYGSKEVKDCGTATEIRITDPTTGGQKGSKLQRYDLLPARQLHELAEIYGLGSVKYADRNWEKGYKWSLSFASLMRHAWLFWSGVDRDKETGKKHILHAAWHCLALAEFAETHPEKDDRVKEVKP